MFAVVLLASSLLSTGVPPAPFELGPIDEALVDKYADALSRTASGGVLQVRVDSPGGDAYQLLRLLGLSDEASHRQITIVCRLSGIAASAAAIYFVVGCDRRLMGPKATLLFHNAYVRKDLPFAIDPHMVVSLDRLNHILAELVANSSHVAVADYEAAVKDGDWTLLEPEALSRGFADSLL